MEKVILRTKNGEEFEMAINLGHDWGMTYVEGGCDEVNIDTGRPDVREDLFTFLETVLTEESLEELKEDFDTDHNWAIEFEDGAEAALLEHGYKKEGDYYFVRDNERK